ncbi:hypothetical protein Hanom_Chr05g00467461 [Helianthus anomalus]
MLNSKNFCNNARILNNRKTRRCVRVDPTSLNRPFSHVICALYSPVGGRMFLTKIKIAFSALSLILFLTT